MHFRFELDCLHFHRCFETKAFVKHENSPILDTSLVVVWSNSNNKPFCLHETWQFRSLRSTSLSALLLSGTCSSPSFSACLLFKRFLVVHTFIESRRRNRFIVGFKVGKYDIHFPTAEMLTYEILSKQNKWNLFFYLKYFPILKLWFFSTSDINIMDC